MTDPGANATNILGEILWHSTTKDESILQVSHNHAYDVLDHAKRYLRDHGEAPLRFLEVAAYAHITGYLLAQRHGWNATLSDISVETLALGARHAEQNGLDPARVRRVAVDFHDLPFPDAAFDMVFICSALHHTLRWQVVLGELLRVTAPGGILVMPNEPCLRDFCFYKFPTNRPTAFRPVETELQRLGILRTVAEPFLGSRPETLYGMVENQKMPLPEILHLLGGQGTIEYLAINSQANMSSLDQAFLAARTVPRKLAGLPATIETELTKRLDEARKKLTSTDVALGIRFPDPEEIAEMAARVARDVAALPLPAAPAASAFSKNQRQPLSALAGATLRRIAYAVYRAPVLGALAARALKIAAYWAHRIPAVDILLARGLRRVWVSPAPAAGSYDIGVANIFGGAWSAVVRKAGGGVPGPDPGALRYAAGSRKGVVLGYPPALARVLELAHDMVPDIQGATLEQIRDHFPGNEWTLGGDREVRELALSAHEGSIRLRQNSVRGKLVALLRVNGAPLDQPFRIQLLVDGAELAGVDVHQPDSFLLRGELPEGNATSAIDVAVRGLDLSPLKKVPPVRVLAVRVVLVQ